MKNLTLNFVLVEKQSKFSVIFELHLESEQNFEFIFHYNRLHVF